VLGLSRVRPITGPGGGGRPGVRFLLGGAGGLEVENGRLRCSGVEGEVQWDEPFDRLAIGVGADNNTYGIPGVREHCLFLKELADARAVRERAIANLERAGLPGLDAAERRRLLHFLAVGAGPTGVRFAAELYDLLTGDLRRAYPAVAPEVRVTLLEAGPTILGAFDAHLRDHAARHFRRHGIVVRTDSPVAEVGPGWLRLKS